MSNLLNALNVAIIVNVRTWGKKWYSVQIADGNGNVIKETQPINGKSWVNAVNEFVRFKVAQFRKMTDKETFEVYARQNGFNVAVLSNKVKTAAELRF